MQKRPLFFALCAGVLIWGLGALEARAANVPLSTTLGTLLVPGATTTVTASNETDTFSGFTYSVSSIPTGANTLAASAITVSAFPPPAGGANESGISFSGAINALPGTTADYTISYTVTAPVGSLLTDAQLSVVWNNFGGTGASGSIGESLSNGAAFPLGGLSSFNNGPVQIGFAGTPSITVSKDIDLIGGTAGIGVSVVSQAFSSNGVPEPASLALLGIGMTGFFAFRRFFKRASLA